MDQKSVKMNVPPLKIGQPEGLEFGMRDLENIRARHNALHRYYHYIAQTAFLKQFVAISKTMELRPRRFDGGAIDVTGGLVLYFKIAGRLILP